MPVARHPAGFPRRAEIVADRPQEAYRLQVTGSEGECTIPASATAVSINLVAIAPTAASFLVAYPDDQSNPGTAVLNYVAGQAPTPNKVDVKLSPAGKIKLFNRNGNVHVVGDVMGYYSKDRFAALDSRLATLQARVDTLESLRPLAYRNAFGNSVTTVDEDGVDMAGFGGTAVADGVIHATSSVMVSEGTAGDTVECGIKLNGSVVFNQRWTAATSVGGPATARATLSGTRSFDVDAADPFDIDVTCRHVGTSGTSGAFNARLDAVFIPSLKP